MSETRVVVISFQLKLELMVIKYSLNSTLPVSASTHNSGEKFSLTRLPFT